jgi:DNA-directed RNA polymerase subunit alpha
MVVILGIEPEIEAQVIPELPIQTKIEIGEVSGNYGRFVVEPLDRGFAATLGNALRRVLLSSLPGAAITSLQIEDVQHEYSTIPDVREDVTELLLNFKTIRLRAHSTRPGTLRLEVQGPGQVTAGDIQPSADFDIVNPEIYLAALDSAKGRLSIEFNVEVGKGFVPATPVEGTPIGTLPIDAIFTPIRKVNFTVQKTRVGQVTDFERLVLEVTTDGSTPPVDAVREAAQILVDSFNQFSSLGLETIDGAELSGIAALIPSEHYNLTVERLDLSARTLNCLKRSRINKVGELLEMTRDELLKIKNFGEKSLGELYDRLRENGITLPSDGEEAGPGSEADEDVDLQAEAVEDQGEPIEAGAEAEEDAVGAATFPETVPVVVAETPAAPAAPASARKSRERDPKETLHDLASLREVLLGESAPDNAKEGGEEAADAETTGKE